MYPSGKIDGPHKFYKLRSSLITAYANLPAVILLLIPSLTLSFPSHTHSLRQTLTALSFGYDFLLLLPSLFTLLHGDFLRVANRHTEEKDVVHGFVLSLRSSGV
jgi:hypothetical protein